jgi:DNA repair exonuclease SbcCD ATPase subunit
MREFFNLDIYDHIASKVKESASLNKNSFIEYESSLKAKEELYDKMKQNYKTFKSETKDEIKELKDRIKDKNNSIAKIEEKLEVLNFDSKEFKNLSIKKEQINTAIFKCNKELDKLNDTLDSYTEMKDKLDLIDIKKIKIHNLNDLHEKLKDASDEINELKDLKIKLKYQKEDAEKYIKEKEKIINDINDYRIVLKDTKKDYDKLLKNISKIDEDKEDKLFKIYKSFDKKRDILYADIERRNKDIDAFTKIGSTCPHCYSNLDNKHKERILKDLFNGVSRVKKEYDELTEKEKKAYDDYCNIRDKNDENDKKLKAVQNYERVINDINQNIKDLNLKLESKEEININAIIKKIKDIDDDIKLIKDIKIDSIESDIKEATKNDRIIKEYNFLKEKLKDINIKDITKKIDALEDEDIELNNDLKKLNIEFKVYEEKSETYKTLQDDIKNINDIKKQIKDKITISNTLIEKEKEKVRDFKQNIKELKNSFSDLEKEKRIIDALQFIISDKGIKKYIIGKYIPSLNTLFYKYSTILESNFILKMKNDMSITVNSLGLERKYYTFSTGERSQINLIILLSFIEMARLMHGGTFNNLFLDELTAPLDPDNTYKMFKLLRTYFDDLKILLITHKETDKEMSFIDKRVQVKLNKQGFSKYKIIKI